MRVLALVALFWLSLGDMRAVAQINFDAIEKMAGSSILEHLSKQASPCRSRFVAAINSKLFEALVRKSVISKKPEVHIFNLKTMNAFAIPGGHIVLTPAFLAALQSSDEYAAVLFHELGHVELGHIRQGGTFDALQSLMFSGEASKLPALLVRRRYSRSQESEADRFSASAMSALGMQPAALGRALQRISSVGKADNQSDLLSTHPLTTDRVASLNAYSKSPLTREVAIAMPAWRGIDLSCP